MAPHSVDALRKLKVTDLKSILETVELPTTGKKDELIERIIAYQEKNSNGNENKTSEEGKKSTDEELQSPPAEGNYDEEFTKLMGNHSTSTHADVTETKHDATTDNTQKETGNDFQKAKESRAQRFGIPITPAKAVDADKKKQRAERFGSSTTETPQAAQPAMTAEEKAKFEEAKKKRADRFNITEDPAAKKLKQTRFGTPLAVPSPKTPAAKPTPADLALPKKPATSTPAPKKKNDKPNTSKVPKWGESLAKTTT